MNNKRVPLEYAAEQVSIESAKPPLIFQLPPEQGRQTLDKLQDSPVYKAPAQVNSVNLNTGKWGTIPVHIVIPDNLSGTPDVIFYIHGAGWVFGDFHTHEKLVRELASRTNSILIFPEYTRSPEAKFPTAIEQCYVALNQIPAILEHQSLDADISNLTVSGDSVGGNMAAVMCLMSKFRQGMKIHKQLLYYPVTNANFNTKSYLEFAEGYYLYRAGMMWFWNQYAPNTATRKNIFAAPLLATKEQLSGLPEAMIINGEADVLRDEGEEYARKLRAAGVDVATVQFNGMIHDFVMLNSLDQTEACRGAMDISTAWVNRKNKEA